MKGGILVLVLMFWPLIWFGLKEGELDWTDACFLVVLWLICILMPLITPQVGFLPLFGLLILDCILIMKVFRLERY